MSGQPLIFSIFGQDHSLFESISDPRISVRWFNQSDQYIPDALVLCRPEAPQKVDYWRGVPDRLWLSVAGGRTKLVLDASPEGLRVADMGAGLQRIHRFLHERGIRRSDVAYVTQDRMFEADYRALCSRVGENPMHVLVYDYFVQRLAMELPKNGAQLYEQRLRAFEDAGATRERVFLSLNYTPRPNKLIFLLSLIEHGLWDEGTISFGGFEWRGNGSDSMNHLGKQMRLLPGFEDLGWRLAGHLEALHAKGRITFALGDDPRKYVKKTYPASGLAEYLTTWFSVVTETEMGDRINRLTEKSLKPLLNFHPMLVLGNPFTLELVRRYGFETFGEMFDESYDEEPDPRRRFELVFAQLQRFCRQDRERLPQIVGAVSEKLRFNAWCGLVDLPKRFRKKWQPWFIEALLKRWDVKSMADG